MKLELITPHTSLYRKINKFYQKKKINKIQDDDKSSLCSSSPTANGFLEEKDRECVEAINEEEELHGCVHLLGNLEFERWVVLESGSAADRWREATVEKEAVASMEVLRQEICFLRLLPVLILLSVGNQKHKTIWAIC